MNQFRYPKPRSIALHYNGMIYHINVQQVFPERYKAACGELEAYGPSPLHAQAKLLMKIDPANVHVVRDSHGNQLA